jgi:hypothetical protein
MQNLTLGDLVRALKDLFTTRLAAFQTTTTFALYGPMLSARRSAIEALPEALTSNRPKAALLAESDIRHDGFGAALWYLFEAILRHPKCSPELKAAVLRARQKFIPKLGVLKDSYADEANAAHKHRPALAELEADLKLIKTPDGATAYEWVSQFLDEGDTIGQLLSDRAFIEAGSDGAAAAASLRASTIGLLGRARDALRDEVTYNPALPRNIEAVVFGYFDVLQRFREENATSAEPPAPPAQPAAQTEG